MEEEEEEKDGEEEEEEVVEGVRLRVREFECRMVLVFTTTIGI